jgi:hypothetical protein
MRVDIDITDEEAEAIEARIGRALASCTLEFLVERDEHGHLNVQALDGPAPPPLPDSVLERIEARLDGGTLAVREQRRRRGAMGGALLATPMESALDGVLSVLRAATRAAERSERCGVALDGLVDIFARGSRVYLGRPTRLVLVDHFAEEQRAPHFTHVEIDRVPVGEWPR